MLRSVLPRLGYAAVGLLWITIGAIAARIGFLGARDHVAGMPGALRFLLRQKEGQWILGAVTAGLALFAVWRLLQAAAGREGTIARIGQALTAIGYGALSYTGLRMLLRVRGGDRLGRAGVAWLLAHRTGRQTLQVAGVLLLACGAIAVLQGVTGRLPRWLAAVGLGRTTRRYAQRAARVGLAARGVVMLVTGYFVLRAVRDLDPTEVREVGGSLAVLSRSPLGPMAMGLVAVGLVSYGVSLWVLAVSRRPA